MKTIRIAELKARLSEFLRLVRGGQSITVLDRDTPVAQIVPIRGSTPKLITHKPARGSVPFGKITLPPPLRIEGDIVDLLLAERENHR